MGRRPEVFVRQVSMVEGQRLQRITRTAKDPVKLGRAIVGADVRPRAAGVGHRPPALRSCGPDVAWAGECGRGAEADPRDQHRPRPTRTPSHVAVGSRAAQRTWCGHSGSCRSSRRRAPSTSTQPGVERAEPALRRLPHGSHPVGDGKPGRRANLGKIRPKA